MVYLNLSCDCLASKVILCSICESSARREAGAQCVWLYVLSYAYQIPIAYTSCRCKGMHNYCPQICPHEMYCNICRAPSPIE